MDTPTIIMTVIVIGIIVAVYFLPTIVASDRGHHNIAAIFVLNLFLGWSFLGWVIALVWAFTYVRPQSVVIVQEVKAIVLPPPTNRRLP